jgi:hypothetical protein
MVLQLEHCYNMSMIPGFVKTIMVAVVKRNVYWSTKHILSTPEILYCTRKKNMLSNFNNNVNYTLQTILSYLCPSLLIPN